MSIKKTYRMKSFKQLKEDIANVSAGIGVRGFGDVSGTPKIGEEDDQSNPHIERVVQGADQNNDEVLQLIKNNTDGIYTWEGGFDWWADRKNMAKYTKGKSAEPLGFRKLKAGDLQEEDSSTVTTNAGPGMGDNPTGEVFPDKTKKNKPVWPMFRRLPLQLEEIGGIGGTVGGTSVGTGYIAGVGVPLEGKPSNWGEPGVQPKDQKKKKNKKKEDDPRIFGIFRRKALIDSGLKEIPIQEEVKTGMFAGEQTFIVPSHVFERTLHAKRKGKHWRTYINDEMFHPAIREYANKNYHCPVIIEDEKTGYMCYARYSRKKN